MSKHLGSPKGAIHVAVDVALAVALVAALAIVFWIDGTGNTDGGLRPVDPVDAPKAPLLRLAVTPEQAEYDDMGRLLTTLGDGYQFTRFPFDDLLNAERVGEFDVIFITCSGYPATWLLEATGDVRRDMQLFRNNDAVFLKAKDVLREYVKNGGTLYASDLHHGLVSICFPEFFDGVGLMPGAPQKLKAQVVDERLRELIGPEIELEFDQEQWFPADFLGEDVTVYLKGNYETTLGQRQEAALLVKFPFGSGTVIFTSFHNEVQNSQAEIKLLKYLVFSAVTANVDSEVTRTMQAGGFSPRKKSLLDVSAEEDAVSAVYQNASVADLQFVLGFQDQGARLKLSVIGPNGEAFEKEGSSTLTIDVSDAAPGAWTYTITALEVPSENFPFTITVGEK
jgi:hypothetical protein